MIKINNLSYKYNNCDQPSLCSINTVINEGEYTALIGPNGCGKTTLIRHLNALLKPSSGEVEVDGMSTKSRKHIVEIRRRVGMVFQNPDNQIVGMSVEEDVAFGPGNLGMSSEEMRSRVDLALKTVGLKSFETRTPHSLSGGEKQLLSIAGLLAMDPKYIILDEPTSSLDPASKAMVLDLLPKLAADGIGIIHVTHNMDDAALAQRILVMNNGELVADGIPSSILSRVDWLKSLGLAPPRVTELMWQLGQRGINVNSGLYDLDKAVEELANLFSPPADLEQDKPGAGASHE